MFSDSIMSTLRKCPHCSNNAGAKNTICSRCKAKTVARKGEPRLANLRQSPKKRYEKLSRLFSITETHTARTSASRENSATIAETMNDGDKIARKSVVSFPLLLGDPKRNIPSILLDIVEDMVPTIETPGLHWTGRHGQVVRSTYLQRIIVESLNINAILLVVAVSGQRG